MEHFYGNLMTMLKPSKGIDFPKLGGKKNIRKWLRKDHTIDVKGWCHVKEL